MLPIKQITSVRKLGSTNTLIITAAGATLQVGNVPTCNNIVQDILSQMPQ